MTPDTLHMLASRLSCQAGDPEISAVLFLAASSHIIDVRVFRGDSDRLQFPLKPVVQQGYALGARQLLLFHTHPSGDPSPSARDLSLTRRLCILLRRQQQRLTDHVILAQGRYFSFRANGLL